MARISRHWIALIAAVLILEPLLSAQPAAPAAPSREAILAAAKSIIKTARYATLTTLDESGAPAARIVDPFPPEQELTIWVATNSRTRKAAQLARDGRVTLTYFDPCGRALRHHRRDGDARARSRRARGALEGRMEGLLRKQLSR